MVILVVTVSLLYACKKSNLSDPKTSPITIKNDTSTTLISNTELVGNWNIITDTVNEQGGTPVNSNPIMYYGTAADHFIFTKYGNVYMVTPYQTLTQTSIYTISGADTLNLEIITVDGSARDTGYQQGYIISSLGANSLVLTQSPAPGPFRRYEQITFKRKE